MVNLTGANRQEERSGNERRIIGCPIYDKGEAGPLHIHVKTEDMEGYVQCEKMSLLDLSVRGYSKIDRIVYK